MTCCVTGHRPGAFPFSRELDNFSYVQYIDRLHVEIKKIILEGCDHFITGMAEGADIDFAEKIIYFRHYEEFDIILEAVLPYSMTSQRIIETYSDAQYAVLKACDQKQVISPRYFRGCIQKRNRYMIDN